MSRFLEYGVFVPDPSSSKPKLNPTPPATGQWAQIGGKWFKVGPDGQPLVPTPKSFSQTSPAASKSNGGSDVQGGGGSAADPFSQTEGAEVSPANGGGGGGGGVWEECRKDKGGVGDVFGEDEDGQQQGGCGDDDDDDNSPTIPRTRSSSSAAGSAAPRPTTTSRTSSRGIFGSTASRSGSGEGGGASGGGNGNGEGEEEDETAGGGSGSGNGSSNSGGLTVAVDGGAAGAAGAGSKNAADARPTTMLTPGLSRSYSTDEIVGKFFGEDPGAAPRGGPGSGSSAPGSRGSGAGGFEAAGVDGGAACVGERAVPGAGKEGKKKLKRTGSGSSNTANSPVNRADQEEAEPVETRDVACQWDGSEC